MDGAGKRRDKMEMFFETIEHRLDFCPPAQEKFLPVSHDLLSLGRKRRRENDEGRCFLARLFRHDPRTVVRVSHHYSRGGINQFRQDLPIIDARRREVDSAK